MSKVYSTIYNIEALSNVNIDSKNLNIDSKNLNINSIDTNIYGNINIFGNLNSNSVNQGIINAPFGIKTPNILNSATIDGNLIVKGNLIVNDTVYANKYRVINGVVDGNIRFNNTATFNQININGGNINISNGNIIGPVKIYGLQIMTAQTINTNHVIFRNLEKDFDFSIKETDCKPPQNCTPTWVHIEINGKKFYLFSQTPI